MSTPPPDTTRLCVHTITTKPLSLEQAVFAYSDADISGITVWRQHLENLDLKHAAHLLHDSGLEVVSLCRGGFFPALTAEARQIALDDNRLAIEQASAIGAPHVVLVCGAEPGQPLSESRKQIADGVAALLPEAEAANVKLAIEPLHPMYADTRSAINTLAQANDLVAALDSPWVGIAADVYHLWWDPSLESEIARAGDSILAFHVSDWRTPTRDLLNDRGLMGEGCIPIRQIRGWIEQTGFSGYHEVEIFSETYWAMDQRSFLGRIREAYCEHV